MNQISFDSTVVLRRDGKRGKLGEILADVHDGRFDARKANEAVDGIKRKFAEVQEIYKRIGRKFFTSRQGVSLMGALFTVALLIWGISRDFRGSGLFDYRISQLEDFWQMRVVAAWNPRAMPGRVRLRQGELALVGRMKRDGLFGIPQVLSVLAPSIDKDLKPLWSFWPELRGRRKLKEAFALQELVGEMRRDELPSIRANQRLLRAIGVDVDWIDGELETLSDRADQIAGDAAVRPVSGNIAKLGEEMRSLRRRVSVQVFLDGRLSDPERYPALGKMIGGLYTITGYLGEGGLAHVYLGVDPDGEYVAVKVPKPDPRNRKDEWERTVKRLEEEGRLLAELQHSGLAKAIGHWTVEGLPYFVMDFMSGETVAQRMKRRGGRLEAPEAARILSGALEILSYLGQQGICYRDLKPENIMVRDDGSIGLIDLGISHKIGPHPDDEIIFTDGYAPLDYFTHRRSDERFDVYTAGRTLRAMLTGFPESTGELSDFQALNEVGETAEQPDAGARYANAEEMRQALQKAREHLPATTTGRLAPSR